VTTAAANDATHSHAASGTAAPGGSKRHAK